MGDAMTRLQMNGDQIVYIDKRIDPMSEFCVNVTVEKLPDYDRNIFNSVEIGVAFYDKNERQYGCLAISNRCQIYKNDKSLGIANFDMMRSESQIIINVKNGQIKFQHLRNGKMYKYNEK